MKRPLSVWLPGLAVDATRRDPGRTGPGGGERRPLVLLGLERGRQVVRKRCSLAAEAGVVEGMGPSEASALLAPVPVRFEDFDEEREAAELAALAQHALRFSPNVALDPPDGLLLDVAGCERLFGGPDGTPDQGEEGLVRALLATLSELGFRARAAVAATIGCAWAVARFAPLPRGGLEGTNGWRIPAERESPALAPLPVLALRAGEETAAKLAELGVDTIGDLLALPRDELSTRFGSELLLHLDQALGHAFEPVELVRPASPVSAGREFQTPVQDLLAIQTTVELLTEELCAELFARGTGALRLELELVCCDAPPARESIALSRPSRDAAHWNALLRPRLERLAPPAGIGIGFGVERVVLLAADVAPVLARQEFVPGFAEQAGDSALARELGELFDTIASRFGPGSLLTAELRESHVPERAFAVQPLAHGQRPTDVQPTPFDRPSRLFHPPEPIEVLARPDGTPERLRWRGHEEPLELTAGPERIAAPWWGPAAATATRAARDYWRARTGTGRWLWLFREPDTAAWFAHGEWA